MFNNWVPKHLGHESHPYTPDERKRHQLQMIQLLVDSNNRVPFLDQANLLNMLIYHLEKYEDLCRNCPREENPREQSVGIAKVKELVQKLSNRIIQTDNQN